MFTKSPGAESWNTWLFYLYKRTFQFSVPLKGFVPKHPITQSTVWSFKLNIGILWVNFRLFRIQSPPYWGLFFPLPLPFKYRFFSQLPFLLIQISLWVSCSASISFTVMFISLIYFSLLSSQSILLIVHCTSPSGCPKGILDSKCLK